MCFGPSTLGAEAKTRLESRIKKFTPHCVFRYYLMKGTPNFADSNMERKLIGAGLMVLAFLGLTALLANFKCFFFSYCLIFWTIRFYEEFVAAAR